jgi:hypothetical protein
VDRLHRHEAARAGSSEDMDRPELQVLNHGPQCENVPRNMRIGLRSLHFSPLSRTLDASTPLIVLYAALIPAGSRASKNPPFTLNRGLTPLCSLWKNNISEIGTKSTKYSHQTLKVPYY